MLMLVVLSGLLAAKTFHPSDLRDSFSLSLFLPLPTSLNDDCASARECE